MSPFLHVNGTTIIFHRNLVSEDDARMFIHRQSSAQEQQVITARDSDLTFAAPGAEGQLRLSRAEISQFATTATDWPELKLSATAEQMLISDDTLVIPAFRLRETYVPTMTLQELILQGPDWSRAETEAILRIAMGGVLALLAPLIAACSMGMTRVVWRFWPVPQGLVWSLRAGSRSRPSLAGCRPSRSDPGLRWSSARRWPSRSLQARSCYGWATHC